MINLRKNHLELDRRNILDFKKLLEELNMGTSASGALKKIIRSGEEKKREVDFFYSKYNELVESAESETAEESIHLQVPDYLLKLIMDHVKNQIEVHVQEGNFEKAISKLLKRRFVFSNRQQEAIIHVSSRYGSLKRKEIHGLISPNEFTVESNKISRSIIEVIREENDEKMNPFLYPLKTRWPDSPNH